MKINKKRVIEVKPAHSETFTTLNKKSSQERTECPYCQKHPSACPTPDNCKLETLRK